MSREYIEQKNVGNVLKDAVAMLLEARPNDARAFLADAIGGRDTKRFMLVSSDVPDLSDYLAMVKCHKALYNFETQTVNELVAIIRAVVAANGKFKSIALASHGPSSEGVWSLSKNVVLDLSDPTKGGAMAVLEALAEGVEKNGRVDLLSCSLIATAEGKAFLQELETRTGCNFAASTDKTGNPSDSSTDWVMESDNVDIRPLYFSDTSLFDGKLEFKKILPPPGTELKRISPPPKGPTKIIPTATTTKFSEGIDDEVEEDEVFDAQDLKDDEEFGR